MVDAVIILRVSTDEETFRHLQGLDYLFNTGNASDEDVLENLQRLFGKIMLWQIEVRRKGEKK